jgi:hypothetical protein
MIVLAVLLVAAWSFAGCDAAEEVLEEVTDMEWELDESQFEDQSGVDTPYNWDFLFAVKLSADQAELIDEGFDVDISLVEEAGIDLGEIDNQVIMAHVASVGDKPGLRYANKILIEGGKIVLDGQSIDKLGDSVGASGAGWYVSYHSRNAVGFVKGEVKDCDGQVPAADQLLVNLSDGPFFTYASAEDGSYALPSVNGKPAAVAFDAGDCAGTDSAPVTDPGSDPNGKDPGTEPNNDPLDDGTNIIDAGLVDLSQDGAPDGGEPATGTRFEFDGADGAAWASTGNCYQVLTDADDYGVMFPAGTDATSSVGFLSTGDPDSANLTSCTITRTFTVPATATKMLVAYDFISQEYEEWVGSAYNDIFTVIIQGEFDYVVHRTINGANYWVELTPAEGDIGWIGDSADAQYNPTNPPEGYSNGPGLFDGHLDWGTSDSNTPRGNNDDNLVYGRVAEYPVTGGATITVLITVSDVADAIYDSAGALDYVEFQ